MSEIAVSMPLRQSAKPEPKADSDEFFVGYLATPDRLSRWLKRVVFALAAMAVTTAAVIAAFQNDPGDAAWSIDHVENWEGTYIARPYPMLRIVRADDTIQTFLLVAEGKRGVADRLPAYDCAHVRIKGTLLQRDGRQMIELLSSDDGFELISGDAPDESLRMSPALSWRTVELRGEVIDPKCYLGAMKPGEGKVHKACAALCLRGGIPPMFVTGGPGERRYFLLVSGAQQAVTGDTLEQLAAVVGDPVRTRGSAAEWGDATLLKIEAVDVERE